MDPNDIVREAVIALVKEGIKSGFNFLTTKLSRGQGGSAKAETVEELADEDLDASYQPLATPTDTGIHWHKAATLFWLGNDLMWIQDQMYRGSTPARVLQGVENAIAYCRDLGFEDKSFPIQNLGMSKEILQSLPEILVDGDTLARVQHHYASVEKDVVQTKFFIQALAEGQEPGFVKRRAFPSRS
jgi:hypothetical protein